MSIRLRIDSVELETAAGPTRYDFSGPLTVLSGPVGVGKSTLFETIKFAMGGRARLAPVVRDQVTRVRVTIRIEENKYELTRDVTNGSNYVEIFDITSGVKLGPVPIQTGKSDQWCVSDYLMTAMGLPTTAFSTSKTRSSRITFNSIWSFVYVEQREIDRSIARNNDTYAEPSRKATFELLFGLTDSTVLNLKKAELDAETQLSLASNEEQLVINFLNDSRTSRRAEVEAAIRHEQRLRENAEEQLAALEREAKSVRNEVSVVRDLVLEGRAEVARLHSDQQDFELAREEQLRLLARLRTRQNEIVRAEQASSLLAPIDFIMCPRCAQSIADRKTEPGTCTLCLQHEPVPNALLTRRSEYESQRLDAQIGEVETLIDSAMSNLGVLHHRQQAAQENLSKLEALLDERTKFFVSPRLEQYADASSEIARADAVVSSMEVVLRQWDRAADLASTRIAAEGQLTEARVLREEAEDALAQTRARLLEALSADYQDMVTQIGVPSVTSAFIDKKNFLPFVNGLRFDKLSTGGITTALVTAYWVTVLATALRERETNYPTLLILDSPRKSIGSQNSQMVNELYRQLDILAESYGNNMQVIVADNDIPTDISKRWQDLRFDYDHPTVATVRHPGLASVTPIDRVDDDS
ncbi:AAA family ATPase [Mycolicibacterium sp. P9-22]|uniref:AAA family ATPase n=1 Tax=Mycolicibacterium sp. P9-22 TaxID=2024613 RepID=UPI0011F08E73|nr:AAA family ATPase [Mycolicibacterium sp. P9-22]KAA0120508.1 hypothetical protein CIW51_03255 [Mycolicibacterium sp. P9-22]